MINLTKLTYVLFFLLVNCHFTRNPIKNKSSLIKIIITNHTENLVLKKDSIIVDKQDLKLIAKQFCLLKEISDINLKSNFGFYEVNFKYQNNESEKFDVVYTTYNGVIIYNELKNISYKNDYIESLMIQFLVAQTSKH